MRYGHGLRNHTKKFLLGAASMAVLAGAPGLALAQEQEADTTVVEELIVTSTLRDVNLQDVPFSVNAQTQEDIQKSNAVTIEDLSRNIAGLTVQNLGPGQSQVSVRGVS